MGFGWVRYRIEYLRKWRYYVELLAKSIEELLPSAEIYVFGGAAEDRLTVLGDIDVLVVVDKPMSYAERRKLKAEIIWDPEKYGFPWDYPVDIRIVTRSELPQYLRYAKKLISISRKQRGSAKPRDVEAWARASTHSLTYSSSAP